MFALWLLETQTTLSYGVIRSVYNLAYPNWRAAIAHAPLKNQFRNMTHFVWHPQIKKLVTCDKWNWLTVWTLHPTVTCWWQVCIKGPPLKIACHNTFGILILRRLHLDVYDGQTIQTLDGSYADVAWAPDGSKFLAVGGRYISLLSSTGQLIHRLDHGQYMGMTRVCWRPDGLRYLTSCKQGNIYLWTYDGRCICQVDNAHAAPIDHLEWNPTGTNFASIIGESVNIWDVSGALLYRIHVGPTRSFNWSPDGTNFVTCGDAVRMYTAGGRVVAHLEPKNTLDTLSQKNGPRFAYSCWVRDAKVVAISTDGALYKWTPKQH